LNLQTRRYTNADAGHDHHIHVGHSFIGGLNSADNPADVRRRVGFMSGKTIRETSRVVRAQGVHDTVIAWLGDDEKIEIVEGNAAKTAARARLAA